MRVSLKLTLTIERDDKPDEAERGDAITTPVGFVPTPGDQRWQPGADL